MNSQSLETLVTLTGVALIALLFAVMLGVARAVLLQRLGNKVYLRLGEKVILKSLGPALTIPSRTGPLSDVNSVRQFIASRELLNMMDLPFTALFLFVLFLIHPTLGYLGIVMCGFMMLLAIVSAHFFAKRQMIAAKELRRSEKDYASFASEGGLVNALSMTEQVGRKWLLGQLSYVTDVRKAGRGRNVVDGLSQALRLSGQIIGMGAAAMLALAGELNPGMILATSILLTRAMSPIEGTITGHLKYKAAREAYRRVSIMMSRPDRQTMYDHAPKSGGVKLTGLVYMPQGGVRKQPVVRGANMTISAGETVAINGPSGAGKSILAQLVIGALDPSAGSVQLDGAELRNYPRNRLLGAVGYLPQTSDAMPGTVAENICMFQPDSDDAVWDAIRTVEMEAEIGALPDGVDTSMSFARDHLAPGLYRRLLLARAMFGSPKLVVMDEPDLYLDQVGGKVLLSVVAKLKQAGCTVMLISPRGPLSQQADARYVMNNGVIEPLGAEGGAGQRPAQPGPVQQPAAQPQMPAAGALSRQVAAPPGAGPKPKPNPTAGTGSPPPTQPQNKALPQQPDNIPKPNGGPPRRDPPAGAPPKRLQSPTSGRKLRLIKEE
ncbi:ATP-binding cassette domain-containing protein [Falsiruegeria litorea]|nr:ATP-binding cassette domain-containing protein [Falsiruegeria litorea]